MSLRSYANAPATTLSASVTALATTMTLASVTGLPITYPYILIVDRGTASEEVVLVTNAAGNVVTVERGYDGTTAFSHASGAAVVHGISAIDPREANAHVNETSNVHGVSGTLVGTGSTQTLTNKDLSSVTNTFPSSLATDAEVTSAISTHAALTATHGATGAVVGTTNTQTLTNKTLTAPTISDPTVTGVGQVLRAIKSADEVYAATTLQNDDHLSLSLGAGTYLVDMWVQATAGNDTPDIAMAFTYSGTQTAITYGTIGAPELSVTGVASHSVRSTTTATAGGVVRSGIVGGTQTNFIVRGAITTTTSGTLQFQWAQDTTSVQNVTVLKGSWLKAERVA